MMDLIQEGNIGLMQAVKRYDPYRGVKLSSYAAWWIRAYMLRFILNNWRMVKLGTTQAQRKLFFKLSKEQGRLLARAIEATPKLLAARLDVPEQDVVEMDQRLRQDEVGSTRRSDDDAGPPRAERVHCPRATPAVDEGLGQRELTRWFHEKLDEFATTLHDERSATSWSTACWPRSRDAAGRSASTSGSAASGPARWRPG